jgi:hypothetical protein
MKGIRSIRVLCKIKEDADHLPARIWSQIGANSRVDVADFFDNSCQDGDTLNVCTILVWVEAPAFMAGVRASDKIQRFSAGGRFFMNNQIWPMLLRR